MTKLFLLVFVLDVPSFSVWDDAEHAGVKLARHVEVAFICEALDVLLNLSRARVLLKRLIWLAREAWKLK